jgi:hypothetical protein
VASERQPANDRLARRARQLRFSDVRVPFYCECNSADCSESVRLPLADYDDLRYRDEAIIAAEHQALAPDPSVRER